MFHKFLYAITILTVIATGYLMYERYRPVDVIDVKNLPFPLEATKVKRGDTLVYEVSYCKRAEVQGVVSRQFVNHDNVYILDTFLSNAPLGCKVVKVNALIPHDVPLGTYRLEILAEYRVNEYRVITKNLMTEEFTVVE